MSVDPSGGEPNLRLAGLGICAAAIVMAFVGYLMWQSSEDFRAAAQGTGGTPGTFTASGSRTDEGMVTEVRCYGTFRPDGGGPEQEDVQARGMPDSDCVRGRNFKARLTQDLAILPGSDEWEGERVAAIAVWALTPVICGVMGFIVASAARGRRNPDNPDSEV